MTSIDMKIDSIKHTKGDLQRQFLLTIVFNTLIALLLTAISFGMTFSDTFIISQCIGLSIYSLHALGDRAGIAKTIPRRIVLLVSAIVVGAVLGTMLAIVLLGWDTNVILGVDTARFLTPVYLGLFFGAIISFFFYSRALISETKSRAHEAETRRLDQEKQLLEAQLKLIQAQIEPHFLFNTLANVSVLIKSDAGTAQRMLDDLNRYLRTSLDRTRDGETTLGQEVESLKAYLSIIQVRMGDRLRYEVDIPSNLSAYCLPPMLLQPLVENAIRHGLEPKQGEGELYISGKEDNGQLVLAVHDTGVGLSKEWVDGMGLGNVRRRLRLLYGDEGELDIRHTQEGTRTEIRLPLNKC